MNRHTLTISEVLLFILEVEAKGISDRLSEDQVTTLINKQELTAYTARDAPHNAVSLWIQEQKCEGLEFEAGDSVRVKTNGDSPFICEYRILILYIGFSVGLHHPCG